MSERRDGGLTSDQETMTEVRGVTVFFGEAWHTDVLDILDVSTNSILLSVDLLICSSSAIKVCPDDAERCSLRLRATSLQSAVVLRHSHNVICPPRRADTINHQFHL